MVGEVPGDVGVFVIVGERNQASDLVFRRQTVATSTLDK